MSEPISAFGIRMIVDRTGTCSRTACRVPQCSTCKSILPNGCCAQQRKGVEYTKFRSAEFRNGTTGCICLWGLKSAVAQHVLVTVPSLPPRRGEQPSQSVFGCSCCLRPPVAGSALGVHSFARPQCVLF